MAKKETVVILRGHHLEHLAGWRHTEGNVRIFFILQISLQYTPAFARDIATLFENILFSEPKITLVAEKDDICATCPLHATQQCQEKELVEEDMRILKFYGLSAGKTYSVQFILHRLAEKGFPPKSIKEKN